VPKKTPEDRELEARVCAHIRQQMVERRLGVNAMGRKLGMKGGTLSKILWGERGLGSGYIMTVHRALSIHGNILLDEDPPKRFYEPGPPAEVSEVGHPSGGTSAGATRPRRSKAHGAGSARTHDER
jgi:hypothetical protein